MHILGFLFLHITLAVIVYHFSIKSLEKRSTSQILDIIACILLAIIFDLLLFHTAGFILFMIIGIILGGYISFNMANFDFKNIRMNVLNIALSIIMGIVIMLSWSVLLPLAIYYSIEQDEN